jgi:glycosyltransferase involved in cell wall biosynthesis
MLLEAFLEVAERHPRLHLAFVGGVPGGLGVRRPPVDAQIYARMLNRIEETGMKGRVHFTGRQEDTVPYYRALDVFALSSQTEQMPLSVAEAMACGKPVLSTDVGDVRRMVCAENRPFVISDPRAYAAVLRRLLEDAPLRARLGAANRVRAVERYDRAGMIEAYRSFLGEFMGLPRGGAAAATRAAGKR